jgi:hypothetical protein
VTRIDSLLQEMLLGGINRIWKKKKKLFELVNDRLNTQSYQHLKELHLNRLVMQTILPLRLGTIRPLWSHLHWPQWLHFQQIRLPRTQRVHLLQLFLSWMGKTD